MALRWNRSLAAIVLVVLAGRADAGLLPTSSSTQTEGSNTMYSYGVSLTSDMTLKSGDYFTVYDFQGYVPSSNMQPSGWTLSVANTGMTPGGISVTDNASQPNLTWTYTGATLTGPQNLGTFSALSTNAPGVNNVSFSSLSQRQVGGDDLSTATSTTGPGAQLTTPPGVPEPATLALVGCGLPFLGLLGRRRRKE